MGFFSWLLSFLAQEEATATATVTPSPTPSPTPTPTPTPTLTPVPTPSPTATNTVAPAPAALAAAESEPVTTVTIDYAYDPLYRLVAADYSTGEFFHYTYDPVGNRLTQGTHEGDSTYLYDPANRLTELDGAPLTWSPNGNLLALGERTLTYDHANRLTGVTDEGASYGFAYNGLGDRLGQTVDGLATSYALDLNNGLTQVLSDGPNSYLYGASRIGEQGGSDWSYHVGDALGSVRQLVDPAAEVTLAQSYEPFGSPLLASGTASTPYGFTGEWTDGTGLVHLRARYYHAGFGRFIAIDPLPSEMGLILWHHEYAYANSNPVNVIDPSGHWSLAPGFDLYPGGFYNYGRMRFESPLPCDTPPPLTTCIQASSHTADIYVPPPGISDDIRFVVYPEPVIPEFDPMQPLVQMSTEEDAPTLDELVDSLREMYPIRIDTFLEFADSCRAPATSGIEVAEPYISGQWEYVTQYHGFSNSFGSGIGVPELLALTNRPEMIPPDMYVTAACGLGSCTYGDIGQGTVGGWAQAIQFVLAILKARSVVVIREFWANVERNRVRPDLFRATILTKTNTGFYSHLWYEESGWHETPVQPGMYLLAP